MLGLGGCRGRLAIGKHPVALEAGAGRFGQEKSVNFPQIPLEVEVLGLRSSPTSSNLPPLPKVIGSDRLGAVVIPAVRSLP
jgi:hypothetical protein